MYEYVCWVGWLLGPVFFWIDAFLKKIIIINLPIE